jgi:hypothetical protein
VTDDTLRCTSGRTSGRTARLLAVIAAAGVALTGSLTLAAPADAAGGTRFPHVADLGPTSFAKRGPFAVGETTLKLPTNQAPVEVWYPSRRADAKGRKVASYDLIDWLPASFQSALPDGASVAYPSGGVRGLDVARGRFPLVVFSHGYAGFRDQSSRDLTAVLDFTGASTGTTTDVDDLRATITLMTRKSAARPGRFAGHIDTTLVGAVGHSAGGGAVQELAAADRRVTTFVGLAPAPGEGKVPRQPGLFMAGTSDGIISKERITKEYEHLKAPKRLVLVGGGHHAFSDLCEVGAEQGGLLQVAELLHFPVSDDLKRLATDGCEPPALPPTEAWPAIRQTVVAHLRHVFGFDRSTKGLRGLKEAFPGVVSGSRTS